MDARVKCITLRWRVTHYVGQFFPECMARGTLCVSLIFVIGKYFLIAGMVIVVF